MEVDFICTKTTGNKIIHRNSGARRGEYLKLSKAPKIPVELYESFSSHLMLAGYKDNYPENSLLPMGE